MRQRLGASERKIIDNNRELFDWGVHGPDLMFYYHPFFPGAVNMLGRRYHKTKGCVFFEQQKRWLAPTPGDAADGRGALSGLPEPETAYLMGVLCHFVLDRECHPYIGRIQNMKRSHSAIEASFDRLLMEKDGIDPLNHVPNSHLIVSGHSAEVIRKFYPELTAAQVIGAERGMRQVVSVLASKGLKRRVLMDLAVIIGKRGMFITREPNPICHESDRTLLELYDRAAERYPGMLAQLWDFLLKGEKLGTEFDHTFGRI